MHDKRLALRLKTAKCKIHKIIYIIISARPFNTKYLLLDDSVKQICWSLSLGSWFNRFCICLFLNLYWALALTNHEYWIKHGSATASTQPQRQWVPAASLGPELTERLQGTHVRPWKESWLGEICYQCWMSERFIIQSPPLSLYNLMTIHPQKTKYMIIHWVTLKFLVDNNLSWSYHIKEIT